METLIKPAKLSPGDKIATISLSWGGAGELLHRYLTGKRRLEEVFGLNVVESRHSLMSAEWIYKNPKARAEDLMESFSDTSIKAIITNIGGSDSLRTLPFMDLSVIKNNPKIFLGFSDSTITHFACFKAGLTSFYGTSTLVGFAENAEMFPYQINDLKKTLFNVAPPGQIEPSADWTSERLEWADPALQDQKRKRIKSTGWNFLQGQKTVRGKLLGGCLEVLEFLKETAFWIPSSEWKDTIMFIETSEEMLPPSNFRYFLRNCAAQGIFHQISGLIVGRPYDNKFVAEYNQILLQVIREEEQLGELPIITEMDFGHTSPAFTIPYGVEAEIDCKQKSFSLLQSGVVDNLGA